MSAWKKLDKVTIVYECYQDNKTPTAFVVETGNDAQLKTAINWAKHWHHDITPEMVTTENKDFSFEIISSAGNSYNGGKLSFWMCRIKKEGIKTFDVGINANLLVDTIRESTLINGKIQNKVFFARLDGNLGVLHENMQEYQQFIKDQTLRDNVKNGKKTTKWQPGWTYQALTETSVMYGYYPQIVKNTDRYYNGIYPTVTQLDFNAKDKPVFYTYNEKQNYSELIKCLCCGMSYAFHDKCPSRVIGKQIFVIEKDYYNNMEKELLNATKNIFTNFVYDIKEIPIYAFMMFKINPYTTIKILQLAIDLFDIVEIPKFYKERCVFINYDGQEYFCAEYKAYYQMLLEIAQKELKKYEEEKIK